jgi:alpha-glucosidase
MNMQFKNIVGAALAAARIGLAARLSLAALVVLVLFSCSTKNAGWEVKSPAGNIRFTILPGDSGKILYSVDLIDSGRTMNVIDKSPLGLIRNDGSFAKNLEFVKVNPVFAITGAIDLPSGKQRHIENHGNELMVTFKNSQGQLINVIARAYNDGVAFRYSFPEESGGPFTIEKEITGFKIQGPGNAWIQPYDRVTMWTPAYETFYTNSIPVGTPSDSAQGWAFPALFHTSEAWMLITESAVDSTYFGAHLQPEAPDGLYTIRMPETAEAMNLMEQKPQITLPWRSPWRAIIVGTEISTIVESNMVVKLAPETLMDMSWVTPGRASWSWWSEPASPRNFNALKRYIDLAAEMGWEYSLVDANWDLMKGGNVEQLIRYANTKNIGILLWYNSGGPHNIVTERPRDIMNDPIRRKEEFKRISSLGVKGVKVDFFQSDKPDMMKLYLDILKDAADNKIMVNFHGCTLPRGWNRTWPNLVSMEAVRGAENYQFDSLYPERAVWHNTILPFTRNVVGSMDYTPVAFTDQTYPHKTTYGHELALSIVFESGILHLADRSQAYQGLDARPKEFLKTIPAAWDETILIDGEPGRLCIMARRNGDTWYIGGINGTDLERSWELDLVRLKNHGTVGEIITDGADAKKLVSEIRSIEPGERLKVNIMPNGGFVAVLKQ